MLTLANAGYQIWSFVLNYGSTTHQIFEKSKPFLLYRVTCIKVS